MNKCVGAAGLTLLLLSQPTAAGQYEDGISAITRRDYEAALRLFLPLAEQGDSLSQYNLGLLYDEGHGVAQDYTGAVRWFRPAAGQGNLKAQIKLGFYYLVGRGASRDYFEAAKWFRRCAEQGDTPCQVQFGLLTHRGLGVSQDSVQALMWYNVAIWQGGYSVESRGKIAILMTPDQILEAKRLALEWIATHPKK